MAANLESPSLSQRFRLPAGWVDVSAATKRDHLELVQLCQPRSALQAKAIFASVHWQIWPERRCCASWQLETSLIWRSAGADASTGTLPDSLPGATRPDRVNT